MEDLVLINNINREIAELQDVHIRIPKRHIRDMQNPIEYYNNFEFKRRYRFDKRIVNDVLLPMVNGHLEKPSNRGLPLPPMLCLLITLRYYATGNYQIVSADLRGVSQSSISRCIKLISTLFAHNLPNDIRFPVDEERKQESQRQFYRIAHFPHATGCIDCTHISIKSPGGNMAEVYINRKRYFSINVQVVGDPNLEIFDIVARWPGREHDSMIFNNSAVKAKFEAGNLTGHLLGDSGYPCLPYLMTLLHNPRTNAEERYNRSYIRTRNSV
ncbi:hypothetical protein MML48_4g00015453 [Holotrichia oblita]|uniref:Uncharacterized protein n=1 Tax=Holotrichia oblita TaxID=644536 RepID=A0ACB9T8V4_HOLOL|nr:hypothetical protein MML48_4g00015453 [Holotrichia oblita]